MIKIAFGKACREYREKMNISQEKFALLIGMDRTYYASVESGKRNISIQKVDCKCKLNKIYQATISV
ncbi:helix-turn-helix domain-containing protein, partial [Phascolarctobacterium succinatutens]|uniref:helix-turn-helix domain-containing protein n=1 Tax=Phascolarctobacterium succinatutens TaxID=626940 RepID=UPI0026EE963F